MIWVVRRHTTMRVQSAVGREMVLHWSLGVLSWSEGRVRSWVCKEQGRDANDSTDMVNIGGTVSMKEKERTAQGRLEGRDLASLTASSEREGIMEGVCRRQGWKKSVGPAWKRP